MRRERGELRDGEMEGACLFLCWFYVLPLWTVREFDLCCVCDNAVQM